MRTKRVYQTETLNSYFDELPEDFQKTVKAFVKDFGPEDCIHEIECRSRSGFIPYSWNRGGLELTLYRNLWDYKFETLISLDKEVQKKLNERIESYEADFRTAFYEAEGNLSFLRKNKIKKKDINYLTLEKVSYKKAEEYDSIERESLQDDYASVSHTLRVLYEGDYSWKVYAFFEFSDAPYHRGADQTKEWSVKTSNPATLAKFLNKISKEVAEYLPGAWQ